MPINHRVIKRLCFYVGYTYLITSELRKNIQTISQPMLDHPTHLENIAMRVFDYFKVILRIKI